MELIKTGGCETGKGKRGDEADCGQGYMIFGFEKTGKHYRLTYFGSINE